MHRKMVSLFAALVLLPGAKTSAADHAAIAPYLTDDVSSVVYLDLGKFNLPAIGEEMARFKLIPEADLENAKRETADIQSRYDELTKLGAQRAYVLVRASDVFQGGPTLMIEVADERQAQAVADWLKPWAEKAEALGDVAAYLPKEFEADGAMVIGAASLDRIKAIQAGRDESPREEATAALAVLGDDDAGWVAFGDPDSRRVVREMFPQLPAPFMEIDGKLLADGLKWVGVTLKLPPEPAVTIAVETTGKETAALLVQSVEKALTIAKGMLMAELMKGPSHQEEALAFLPLLPMLSPHREETRLVLTFGDDEQEKAFWNTLLPQFSGKMQTKAALGQRMNQFKQIALGLLNYESARGALPPSASSAPDGKPLLSWRVLILPYIEQMELYNQFHLDEPWDSAHNRKLVEKMPNIYADPDRGIRHSIEAGYTTYQAPVGAGLAFEGREGLKLPALTDGTANTILAVEVVPERAVPWTKPADWEVDPKDALNGVKRSDRPHVTAAYADGHIMLVQPSDPAEFYGALTRAGKEAPPQ